MTKKTRKKYPEEVKAKAVADYLSGARTAKQIAQELDVEVQVIYGWRAAADDKKRNQGLLGLQMEGFSPEAAELVTRQREEIEVYQKKVAELSVMVDLLKKLQTSGPYQPESELSGLIATTKKSERKRRRAK
jgi:transposase-like protein